MSADPRAFSASDYAALAEFRAALRHFTNFSAKAAGEAGLVSVQHQALLAIKGFGGRRGLTVGEIARRFELRPHSAVGLVDRLVKSGLAVRTQDEVDRRRVHVTLSEKGEQVLEGLSAAHREELGRLGPALRMLIERIGAF